LDTDGSVFGGFTPVEWESREWNGEYGREDNCRKADRSLTSFLFTLKNPHNIPARRFALKFQTRDRALVCESLVGPCFGHDIFISDNCNQVKPRLQEDSFNSFTWFGCSYTNDTGLDEKRVFTGSREFQVKEIEVFEITE
jgi:hypothetical protein